MYHFVFWFVPRELSVNTLKDGNNTRGMLVSIGKRDLFHKIVNSLMFLTFLSFSKVSKFTSDADLWTFLINQ